MHKGPWITASILELTGNRAQDGLLLHSPFALCAHARRAQAAAVPRSFAVVLRPVHRDALRFENAFQDHGERYGPVTTAGADSQDPHRLRVLPLHVVSHRSQGLLHDVRDLVVFDRLLQDGIMVPCMIEIELRHVLVLEDPAIHCQMCILNAVKGKPLLHSISPVHQCVDP